jgi:hypothetical protein
MTRILSVGIDDSLSWTGIAAVCRDDQYRKNSAELVCCGMIKGSGKHEWTASAYHIAEHCHEVIMKVLHSQPRFGQMELRISIELPYTWGMKSIVVARTGAVQKLYFLAGCIYGRMKGYNCLLVQVNTWKGSLPKKITYQRMKEKYGFRFPPTEKNFNMSDAVGIADYGLNKRTRDDFSLPQLQPSAFRVL